MSTDLRVAPEVADAILSGAPVVALESTLIVHGLPAPAGHQLATELETLLRGSGVVPAMVGWQAVGREAPVADGRHVDRQCRAGRRPLEVVEQVGGDVAPRDVVSCRGIEGVGDQPVVFCAGSICSASGTGAATTSAEGRPS